jgi:uncharacterized oligopeptide transporter (OPT) family protein
MANHSGSEGFKRFLPRIGSPGYHLMLACVAVLILGPLGGISAAYMNFSIGFYVSGQVLAGILGSTVIFPYGAEGKHGGNYMQTMAASVAGMAAMGVLIQAMVWLGWPQPPFWQIVMYMLCIGMFGCGVGMLYTPLLVDRMQLPYPSGFAVANILRALTDKDLLKRSIAKLGSGIGVGFAAGFASSQIAAVEALSLSVGTVGAGMIVGARIAIPAFVAGAIGWLVTPYMRSIHWLGPDQTFRKTGFIISLGAILGAACLDIVLILFQAIKRYRESAQAGSASAGQQPEETHTGFHLRFGRGLAVSVCSVAVMLVILRFCNKVPSSIGVDLIICSLTALAGFFSGGLGGWKHIPAVRLLFWILFWAVATLIVGHRAMGAPVGLLAAGVGLSVIFALINGISQGLSDWNPISSAFVATVFVLVLIGLRDPVTGLMSASIVFISCSAGSDMQQDRSTGWRLGTDRTVQFYYQVIGIVVGAILAVLLTKLFMQAYSALSVDQSTISNAPGTEKWQSAMTLKLVGALRSITQPKPYLMTGLKLGIGIGLFIEIVRKFIKSRPSYAPFAKNSRVGRVIDFLIDAVLLPSPYAAALGGFVELPAVLWWTAGGVGASLFEVIQSKLARRPKPAQGDLPADMSTMSLVGGGLIAGDSLAALAIGLYGMVTHLLH